jgi:hypothetical protein
MDTWRTAPEIPSEPRNFTYAAVFPFPASRGPPQDAIAEASKNSVRNVTSITVKGSTT